MPARTDAAAFRAGAEACAELVDHTSENKRLVMLERKQELQMLAKIMRTLSLSELPVSSQAPSVASGSDHSPPMTPANASAGPRVEERPGAEPHWPLPSFDARDWAAEFSRVAMSLGYSSMDEQWLNTWFANALMCGYDEARSHDDPPATGGGDE